MTEFKKGDRIVFVEDDHYDDIEMPKGTRGTYDEDDPINAAPYVLLDSGERILAWRDHIAHAEDHGTGDGSASDICAEPGCNCDLERRFPAPLDLTKVKAGDTATVRVEYTGEDPALPFEVTAEVTERRGQRWVGPVTIDREGGYTTTTTTTTLIDHQPAPEPEPYTPDSERVRRAYVDARMDADIIGEEEAGAEFDRWKASLVVIDPADVDRLWAIIREVDGSHDLGPGALAEAILERLAR